MLLTTCLEENNLWLKKKKAEMCFTLNLVTKKYINLIENSKFGYE